MHQLLDDACKIEYKQKEGILSQVISTLPFLSHLADSGQAVGLAVAKERGGFDNLVRLVNE